MRIAIIGAGNVGGGLGKAWRRVGHDVRWGVREGDAQRIRDLPADRLVAPRVAIEDADVIVLAVPWPAVEDAIRSLGDLAGRILIDATNPLRRGDRGPELALGFSTSGAEEVSRLAAGAHVVKTLHQTGAENMADAGQYAHEPVMFVAGDDAGAKSTCLQLVAELGLEPLDAGPLRSARLLEPLALLWIDQSIHSAMGRTFALAIAHPAPRPIA